VLLDICSADKSGREISGLNPVARSESLAAIFSRTDLFQKKNGQRSIAKLKYLVANGDLATGNFARCDDSLWMCITELTVYKKADSWGH
jgi:hypothetical protein